MRFVLSQADSLGAQLFTFLNSLKKAFLLIYLSFRTVMTDSRQGFRQILSVISAQVFFTGWQALPLISVLALATGTVAILQSSTQLSLLGGTSMVGNILVVIIVRELGPLMTALIVIARSGTAVASEIGNMRVNREIEALETMGIQPLSYIVFPRLMGGMLSVLGLAFYFNLVALMGGFALTSGLLNLSFSYYFESLAKAFSFDDVVLFLAKNIFSGLIIFVVACQQGFSVQESPHEVPQVTAKAVVQSIGAVVAFNLTLTILVYLKQLIRLGIL